MIKSRYKLTLSPGSSPWVILDFDELLDADLKPSGQKVSEVVPILDSPDPFLRDGKNTSYTFTFTVRRTAASDALARSSLLDGLISWSARTTGILKLEVQGLTTAYWQFAQALVTAATPVGRNVGLGQTLTEYQVTASGLTKVTVSS